MTRFGPGMSEDAVLGLLKAGTRIAHVPQSLLWDGGCPDERELVIGDRIFDEDGEEVYTDADPWNGLLSLEAMGLVEMVQEPNGVSVWRLR